MILMPESEERDYALVENGEVTRVERMDEESAMLTNSILRMTGEEKRWMQPPPEMPARKEPTDEDYYFGILVVMILGILVLALFRC
jgi:hypothetical protein